VGPLDLILLAAALAMDACAVAVITGSAAPSCTLRQALRLAGTFGAFQALMPALGWLGGAALRGYAASYGDWIAASLLAAIGLKMAWEGFAGVGDGGEPRDRFAWRTLLPLALATSIDACAAGIGLQLLGADLWSACTVIGGLTAVLALIAVRLGQRWGGRFAGRMDLVGGLVLVAMAVRVVWPHLG
jgi:putative Mn2+ efflux pump MntP